MMRTRGAEAIASIAASTSERETLRAVSSTLTWSAASAVSNSLWSSENSGSAPPVPGAGVACMRRYSSRAAACSSGKPSNPSACEKRTTVELDVLARRASSSAGWKGNPSRWSTMYCATSFCERENSSNRARMYAERVWWPRASCGACAVGDPVRFIGRPAIRRRARPFLQGAAAVERRAVERDASGTGPDASGCGPAGCRCGAGPRRGRGSGAGVCAPSPDPRCCGAAVPRFRVRVLPTPPWLPIPAPPRCRDPVARPVRPVVHRGARRLKTRGERPTTGPMTSVPTLRGWERVRWALGALGVLLAACALHAVIGFDAGPLSWLLEKWGYNVVLVGSGLICLLRGATIRTERAAWLTMGVGVIGWAIGNVWYTAVLWDMDPIPIPSPSDVLWIVYYPIVYVAVAMLLRARIARFHASLWVDGALAALAVAALSAAVVFQSVLDTTGGQPLEVATN